METVSFEGVPMFNSFSRSATSGWTVAIGVPKAIIMAEIWRWLWWTVAATTLLSLTGIAFALPLGRSVEKIENRSRRLSAIVEFSDDAIIGYRFDGTIESWNPGAERLFGYSVPEIVERHITILIPDDQLNGFADRLQRLRNGKVVEQHRTTRKHKNGSPLPVSLKISPILDRLGKVVGASAIVRDITSLTKAEEALHESGERFRIMADGCPSVMWVTDAEGGNQFVNRAYREFSGATYKQLEGGKWESLVHPEDAPRVCCRLPACSAGT